MRPPPKLTPREREILPYLVSGATRKEIAATLSVSPETIKIHVKNLLDKFGAVTVRDAFTDLNNYQRFYGLGGLDFNIFNVDIEVTLELMPNRRDARVHRRQLIQAVNRPVTSFVRRFYAGDGEVQLSYQSNRIHCDQRPDESGAKFFEMSINPPIEVDDTYQIDEHIFWQGCLDPISDCDIVTFDTPFGKRTMRHIFPADDPPKEVLFETRVGFTNTKLVGMQETRTANSLVLDFTEYEPGSSLKVTWHY